MKKDEKETGSVYRGTTELPNLWSSDDFLSITHGTERRVHRIYFITLPSRGKIPTESNLFRKLWKRTEPDKKGSRNWFKCSSLTLGISKYGKCEVFSDMDIDLLPSEFIRVMRYDFCLTDWEIRQLAHFLQLRSVEIAHNISDPLEKLKDSSILVRINELKEKVKIFVDKSYGTTELELTGDPESSTNLEFLIRDKLKSVLYFNSLLEVQESIAEELHRINHKLTILENSNILILLEVLNLTELITELLSKTYRTTERLKKKQGEKNSFKK